MTAGVLQHACDCVLSVDIFADRVDICGVVGRATGEVVYAIELCVSCEIAVREAAFESEERDRDDVRATARIILWRTICQGTMMSIC